MKTGGKKSDVLVGVRQSFEIRLSDLLHPFHRISARRQALRAGDRAGMLAGMMSRGGERMSRKRALSLCNAEKVPLRWRKPFTKAFVKAAIFAAHTDHNTTASSKYGVP